MFQIGDRVKCIDAVGSGYGFPLIKDREYIVYHTDTCTCCGVGRVDVGITYNGRVVWCDCGSVASTNGEPWLFRASRFVKVEESYRVIEVSESIVEQAKKLLTPETIAQ